MSGFSTDVDVHIDDRELEAHGYHHKDRCPEFAPGKGRPLRVTETDVLWDAVQQLHEQAHHGRKDTLDASRCLREPCRDLFIRGMGVAS